MVFWKDFRPFSEEPKRFCSLHCFWGRLVSAFYLLLQQCLTTSYLFTLESCWEDICAYILFKCIRICGGKCVHISEHFFPNISLNFFSSDKTLKWQVHLHSPSQNNFFNLSSEKEANFIRGRERRECKS